MVTLLVNVMIKKKNVWKTKHDTLDHQLTIADGPTPQLTDKVDRAFRGNTNQVLQRCVTLVRRIKLRLQGQTATNFGAQLCGIQDNKCVRVVCMEALWMPSHPPKMATAEVVPTSSTRN